ncbi:MAG: hypothetical protein AB8I08_01855 [Sandaracinaceae bacterium]
MDPVNIVLGLVAFTFALLALTQRMRVGDLETKVKDLEAKLADRLPAPPPDPEPAPAPEPEEEDEEDDEEEEDEVADEPAPEPDEEEDEEEAEELEEVDEIEEPPSEPEIATPAEAAEPKVEAAEPKVEAAEPVGAPVPTPPKKAGPDPLRLAALEHVQQAFETCRYLDFDAIVKKPSTYRVTVPVTAASGPALRHLEDGMFPCLEEVRIEGSNAILHIDTSKGPP